MGGDKLCWVQREEIVLRRDLKMQMQGPIPELQPDISCPNVASKLVGKTPKFSLYSGDPTQKGEVSFKQRTLKVKNVMQSHTEATLRERIVWSLCEAAADLVQYLGLQASVSEILNKLEFIYNNVTYLYVSIQNFSSCNKERQKRH